MNRLASALLFSTLALGTAAGCGSSSSSSASAETTPTGTETPGTESEQSETSAQATGPEVLARMAQVKTESCACESMDCLKVVLEANKDLDQAAEVLTESEKDQAEGIANEIMSCMQRINASEGAASDGELDITEQGAATLAKMQEVTTQICQCPDVPCIEAIVQANKELDAAAEALNEDEQKKAMGIAMELAACVNKFAPK